MLKTFDSPISLVGHPFAAMGRGEDLRCCYRAFKAAGVRPRIVNVYSGFTTDSHLHQELESDLSSTTSGGVDVFCINGDEVEPVLEHLGRRRAPSLFSVVIPQWELSGYPASWARALERFDEVWAPSAFIQRTLAAVVGRPVQHISGSTGITLNKFLGRRYFKIPESSYALLTAFDLRQYHERKNPMAVLEAFAQLVRARPSRELVLVVKVSGVAARPDDAVQLRDRLNSATKNLGLGRAVFIEQDLTDAETKNLIRACDCFVSLHRGEGYGRFLAEAMLLGKPVVATAYSGNMDFMTPDVACLVDFSLVPVPPDAYPHWQNQVWADPDVSAAVAWMTRLVDDPELGRAIGDRASRHLRTNFSYRAIGLQYLHWLQAATS